MASKGVKIVSPRSELAVLRGMCSRDKKVAGTLIRQIDESYFYSPESVELYQAIVRYMGENGESPTYRLLIEDPELSKEAVEHMRMSSAVVQTITEANKAAKQLNKYRQLRGLYNLASFIGNELKKSKIDIDGVLQKTATAINVVRSKKSTAESFLHFGKNNSSSEIVKDILYGDNSEFIIPTGIKAFDDASGGLARGGLFTLGATSGGGKSTLANAMALNMAALGYRVVIVPLEMSKKEMTARTMANLAKTNLSDILLQRLATGERELVYKRYKRWVKKVKEKGGRYTIFKPEEDMNIEEVYAAVSAYDCDVVIIDYISLLKGVDGDDQWQALGATARYGKINAENMNRVNILLCQLGEDGKVRYARSISEHSSNSWTWVATKEAKSTGIMRIEQPKSRNSESFPFNVKIDYKFMRVEDVEVDGNYESTGASGRAVPNLAESDV